jgi:hypothetical protein
VSDESLELLGLILFVYWKIQREGREKFLERWDVT